MNKAGHTQKGVLSMILFMQQTKMRFVNLWRQESGQWFPSGVRKRVGPGRKRIQLAET